MGLSQFVGESLFYSSMNSELVELDDPRIREAAQGAVLFVDTLVRFFGEGEENSATDMKLFFSKCHALMRSGVRAVVILLCEPCAECMPVAVPDVAVDLRLLQSILPESLRRTGREDSAVRQFVL